jgi:hypothetical protein
MIELPDGHEPKHEGYGISHATFDGNGLGCGARHDRGDVAMRHAIAGHWEGEGSGYGYCEGYDIEIIGGVGLKCYPKALILRTTI